MMVDNIKYFDTAQFEGERTNEEICNLYRHLVNWRGRGVA